MHRVSHKVYTFGRLWNKKYVTDIQNRMLIHQSKANLDEKISFSNIPHLIDPEIRKMLVIGIFGNNNSTFHSGP